MTFRLLELPWSEEKQLKKVEEMASAIGLAFQIQDDICLLYTSMMRQFFMGIPNELLEAARIDGLTEHGIWFKVMLPLSKPAVATLCITCLLYTSRCV